MADRTLTFVDASVLIYASVKRGITPDINALATLIVITSILGTLLLTLFQRRSSV